MNIQELTEFVGKKAYVQENGLVFTVTITDVKQSYGNVRYLVTPLSGYGQTWMNATRLRVLEGN